MSEKKESTIINNTVDASDKRSNGTFSPPEKRPGNARLKTWFMRLLKTTVAFVLLYLLVRTINGEDLRNALLKAKAGWVLIAALIMPLNLILQGLRWHILIKTTGSDVLFRQSLGSFLGGISLGMVTPGRVGEVGRVFLLNTSSSKLRLAGLHVLDKLYFVGGVGCFGPLLLYTLPGFSAAVPESIRTGILVLVSIFPFLYIYFALQPYPIKGLLVMLKMTFRIKGKLLDLMSAYDGLTNKHALKATLVTLAQFAIIFTQFFCLTQAFEPVPWTIAAHTYGSALFVKAVLPISLGSLGVGEWATVSFYQRYNIADTTGLSASLLLFGLNVLIPSIIGLIVLARTHPENISGRIQSVWGKKD